MRPTIPTVREAVRTRDRRKHSRQVLAAQLRNMASLGRQSFAAHALRLLSRRHRLPCNKRRPGSGCGARSGSEREEHAVLGTSEQCIAVHASDFAVPLMALRRDRAGPSEPAGRTQRFRSPTSFATPGTTRRERETIAAARRTHRLDRDRTLGCGEHELGLPQSPRTVVVRVCANIVRRGRSSPCR